VTSTDVTVKRELKILRRPASTTITDDGALLAVLSTDMQVDLYDLTGEHPKHTRAVALDHTPRTIALSPAGSVLAAAYDSGVEVSSLDPDCISTERRAVKCYAADSLSFSRDGTQLLGTTTQSRNPSTVVLTAPYYDPGGNLPEESVSALWTTSILFPNGSRDCSHAVLLPSPSDDEASWTFTYDRVFETFRAVRIDDLRNGTTYFTGPTADSIAKLLPSTLPAASQAGDLVVAGFQGSIWLYGVPEDLEALPNINSTNSSNVESESSTPPVQLGRRNSAPSLRSGTRSRESTSRTPQWQLLCDKFRNTFVEGRKVTSLDRVSAMAWVNDFSTSFHEERLVAVAPGVGGLPPESEDDSMNPTDGGRISVIDFNYSTNDGRKRTITIEVGNQEPEVLEEEHRDLDTEVALVRRRTVAQRRGNRSNVSRSATTVARPTPRAPIPPMPNVNDLNGAFSIPIAVPTRRPSQAVSSTGGSETASIDEDQEAFDAPYSHTSPRSGTTLRRAATAAAVNRRLHPRAVAQEHIEFRRADGREEHPHESDADNWVPPPPPYTKDPVPPLPEHIQRSILAEAAAANLQRANTQRAPSIDFPGLDGNSLHRSRTFASVSSASAESPRARRDRFPFPRTVSDSTARTLGTVSLEVEPPRRMVSPVSPDFDDLYDVSPPGSPQPTPRRPSEPVSATESIREEGDSEPSPELTPQPTPPTPAAAHQITRKPVGASSPAAPVIPSAAMRATIQQPVSPIPQPMPDTLDRRLRDWEANTESGGVSSPNRDTSPSPSPSPSPLGLTRERMSQQVPPRPNEDHRLSTIPPNTPVLQRQRELIESQPELLSRRSETEPTNARSSRAFEDQPVPVWRRAETAPAPSEQTGSLANTTNVPHLTMPSADQIARLNSRKSRPPSHVMADPRRASSTFPQPQIIVPSPSRRTISDGEPYSSGSIQHTPRRMTPDEAFRAIPQGAVGAHGSSPSRSNTTYSPQHVNYSPQHVNCSPQQRNYSPQNGNHNPQYENYSPQNGGLSPQQQSPYSTPTRRISLNTPPSRPAQSSSPNLRPPMQRLETINSVNSTGEPSPWPPKPMTLGVGRQPSRAERSAAKNIKDAKKRGWRASMRKEEKKRDKWADGASSAGWTDVTEMRSVMGERERGKKTGGKCAVM